MKRTVRVIALFSSALVPIAIITICNFRYFTVNLGRRSFAASDLKLWNSLPPALLDSTITHISALG